MSISEKAEKSNTNVSGNNKKKRLIAIISGALVLVLIVVVFFSCNSFFVSKSQMIVSDAWIKSKDNSLSTYMIFKFDKDKKDTHTLLAIEKYTDDSGERYRISSNDVTWEISGDDLIIKKGDDKQKYSYIVLDDSDLDKGKNKAKTNEWYISNDYLVIGNTVFKSINNEDYEIELKNANDYKKKYYDDLVDDFDSLYD